MDDGGQRAPTAEPGAFPFVFEHRERSLFLYAAAAAILVSHGVDVALHGGANWPALALRLAWALLLLATAAVVGRGVRRHMERMGFLAAFGTAPLFLSLLLFTGRSRGQIFSFTYVLVMVIPMVMPEAVGAAVLASALLLAGAWTILWLDRAPGPELAGWGHVGLVALGIAWLLAHALRRAKLAQAAAEGGRAAARARLAASERRAAEADKLAALGALAGEIAHEINNPLSAARGTVGFLRERLAPGDAEGREACADLSDALDRIARSVWRLTHEASSAAPPDEPGAQPTPPPAAR